MNECEEPVLAGLCVENSECINLPGHFLCKCKPGYFGDGTDKCTLIDEQTINQQLSDGKVINEQLTNEKFTDEKITNQQSKERKKGLIISDG